MWRAQAQPQTRGRELLSRSARTAGADRDGGDRARALVRALARRAAPRAVDWRSRRDTKQARAQAEDRPSGCGVAVAVAGGESFSPNLGTECGESRSATTALAPASAGADADPSEESTAGHRFERRITTPERAVEQARASAAGSAAVGALECTAAAGSAGTARPPEPQ